MFADKNCGGAAQNFGMNEALGHEFNAESGWIAMGGENECKQLCYQQSSFLKNGPHAVAATFCVGFEYTPQKQLCSFKRGFIPADEAGFVPDVGEGSVVLGVSSGKSCYRLGPSTGTLVFGSLAGEDAGLYSHTTGTACQNGDELSTMSNVQNTALNVYITPGHDVEHCKRLCFEQSVWNATSSSADYCRGFTFTPTASECSWYSKSPGEGVLSANSTTSFNTPAGQACYVLSIPPVVYDGPAYFNQSGTACAGLPALYDMPSTNTESNPYSAYKPAAGIDECKQLCFDTGTWHTDIPVESVCRAFSWDRVAEKCLWYGDGPAPYQSPNPDRDCMVVANQTGVYDLAHSTSVHATNYSGADFLGPIGRTKCSEQSYNLLPQLFGSNVASGYRVPGHNTELCKDLCFAASVHNASVPVEQACRGFEYNENLLSCRWGKGNLTRSGAGSTGEAIDCYLISPGSFAYTGDDPESEDEATFAVHMGKKCSGKSPAVEYVPAFEGAEKCKQLCYEQSDFFWGDDGYASITAQNSCRGFDYVAFESCRFYQGYQVKNGDFPQLSIDPDVHARSCFILDEKPNSAVYSGPGYESGPADHNCGGTALSYLPDLPDFTASGLVASGASVNLCKTLCYEFGSSALQTNSSLSASQICRGFEYDIKLRTCSWVTGRFNADSRVHLPDDGVTCYTAPLVSSSYPTPAGLLALQQNENLTAAAAAASVASYTVFEGMRCDSDGPSSAGNLTLDGLASDTLIAMDGENECKQLCFEQSTHFRTISEPQQSGPECSFCGSWDASPGTYIVENNDGGTFAGETVAQCKTRCCNDASCVSFDFMYDAEGAATGSCYIAYVSRCDENVEVVTGAALEFHHELHRYLPAGSASLCSAPSGHFSDGQCSSGQTTAIPTPVCFGFEFRAAKKTCTFVNGWIRRDEDAREEEGTVCYAVGPAADAGNYTEAVGGLGGGVFNRGEGVWGSFQWGWRWWGR